MVVDAALEDKEIMFRMTKDEVSDHLDPKSYYWFVFTIG
jgi:hypothetical protein